jgi:UDP-N-acetylglucosamine acyltransferase
MSIHPTAIVDSKAELAEDVEVQAYSIIGAHVRIGSGTVVGPHCVIDGRTVLGERNRLFSGAQLGVISQDLKQRGEFLGRLEIGNGNVIREHTTISASTMSSYEDEHRVTTVGSDCLIMTCAHIGHDCSVGDNVILANCVALAGHVKVEDRAIVGGLCAVHQFCVIGEMTMIGGMSRIARDAAPYMIVDGNPARCCGPNSVGLRRNGLSDEARASIKAMYKIMFRSTLNTTQAIHEIEATVDDGPERTHFLDFIRNSIRGITK